MTLKPTEAPDWSENHHRGPAKCRTMPPPGAGGIPDPFFDNAAEALKICNGERDGVICPRRTECLRVAMFNSEPYGVWGGMTAPDRLRMRLRHPGMPERWTWHPRRCPDPEETPWRKKS